MQLETIVKSWMSFVVKHPLAVILGSLLVCSGLMSGMPDFRVYSSLKKYIGEESKVIKHLDQLEEEYIEDRNILVMIEPEDGTVFTKDTLAAIQEMTEAAWQIPNIRRVDSLTNFQHTTVNGDELIVEDLVPDASRLTAADIERIKNIALREPRLAGLVVAKDGKATSINMQFTIDVGDKPAMAATNGAVQELQKQIRERYPHLNLYESGYVTMMQQMVLTSTADAKRIYSVSLLLIIGFLVWFFRSVPSTLVVLSVGILSVAGTIGFFGLIGGYLSPPTAMGTLMVLILGLADGVHVVKSAGRFLADGENMAVAIERSITSNFVPIALTSITTAVGFMSFNFNDYIGIKMFGNYVAFGVMLAFVLSVSLLPALLCYSKPKPERRRANPVSYTGLADAVIKGRKPILIGTVILILVSAYCITLNELDDSISRHIKAHHVFRQNTDHIEAVLTGSTSAIYNFQSGEENGVSSPDFMQKVNKFVEWERQQPEVRHVTAYTDTIKQLNQDLNNGLQQNYALPQSKDLAAQYLLLYELSLPYGLDLGNQINLDKSGTRVVVSINDMKISDLTRFVQHNAEWLQKNIPEFDSLANSTMLAANLTVEQTIWNTLEGALGALAVIAVFLMFTFRAIMPGLLCVLTVIAPMIITFGIWGVAVGYIGLPATLALCMVIGISVDFSVHFISKYLHARRQLNNNAEEAIRFAFNSVVPPIFTCTLALGSGFLLMEAGDFQFGATMGLLTAICIITSMVMVFTFLPGLLLLGKRPAVLNLPQVGRPSDIPLKPRD